MDLKQIEAFLAIVKHQNVTKAAEALFVSQSTISHRLKMLETELDTMLVLRSKGVSHISLSPKGEAFIAIANQWMDVHEKTCAFREARQTCAIRIAAPESINNLFKDFYNELSSREEHVRLSIQTCQSRDVASLLEKQEIDMGFSYLFKNDKNIQIEEVGRQKMVILEKATDRRVTDTITPSDLDPSKEVCVKGITREMANVSEWHNRWFDPAIHPYIQVDTPSMILNSIDYDCWCLLIESVAISLADSPSLHIYYLPEPAPQLIYYKLLHRSPKPETAAAMLICDKYIQSMLLKPCNRP